MKHLLFLFFGLFLGSLSYAQEEDSITIIQKNTKHHVKLFAVNHTLKTKQILVELDATGFRRKTFKPIYTSIKASDTLSLATLVKRNNAGLKLNYELYYDARLELYQMQQTKSQN